MDFSGSMLDDRCHQHKNTGPRFELSAGQRTKTKEKALLIEIEFIQDEASHILIIQTWCVCCVCVQCVLCVCWHMGRAENLKGTK